MCRFVWFLFVFMLFIGGIEPFRIRRRRRSCATNGGWSAWSAWGGCVCDHTTGVGIHTATRVCNNPTPKCGGKDCVGSTTQTLGCDAQCCKITHGGYSPWSEWSRCNCDYTTGVGIQTTTRLCNNPTPKCGGKDCTGSSKISARCDAQCCKITHGGYSPWSEWSRCNCDYTTGVGIQTADRVCNNPSPKCGGKDCTGNARKSARCDFQCCRIANGGFSPWSEWSRCNCDYTTGVGIQTAHRVCNNPTPKCGGKDCTGSATLSARCDALCCRKTNGGYSPWSRWTNCTCDSSTGSRTSVRTRQCDLPPSSCGGLDCTGPAKEAEVCIEDSSEICCHFPRIYINFKPVTVKCVHVIWLIVGAVFVIVVIAFAAKCLCWCCRRTSYGGNTNSGTGCCMIVGQSN